MNFVGRILASVRAHSVERTSNLPTSRFYIDFQPGPATEILGPGTPTVMGALPPVFPPPILLPHSVLKLKIRNYNWDFDSLYPIRCAVLKKRKIEFGAHRKTKTSLHYCVSMTSLTLYLVLSLSRVPANRNSL